MISAKSVKELRERTGAGMMDCKKALTETDGDIEKAVEVLREKGLAAAAKKSGRVAAEGLVKTYISEDKKSGAIVELNCETDFVAANEDFIAFADALAKIATSTSATTVEEFVNEKFDAEATIQEALTGLIARLGENMTVRRFIKFAVDNGVVKSYIHGGGRIGVLVEVACDVESPAVEEVAKELCMQIAAANPLFLSKEEVDQDSIEKEKEIYRVQALNEGKPEKIVEKMVMGRIQKYYKEVCLLEQLWVKDGDKTITKFIDEKAKEAGSAIKVNRFVRFERGEGIEKVEENFAEEVAKQLGK
ncbi:elongation factor Ts [Clostridium botulinum]|uniref:translation elongation factor Ts n=1 Tax=Clostridium TaxID=1485 RepID=UPI000507FA66|nr:MULTISPECIES: translation elongation factor Ts [unclassified Clostridium]AIY81724.1 translation elongation factor Ts [Clostridium botulinum 202F]KAI3348611.1 translation elongation factor Ts [Clostridium botulinum]KFX59185.1 elongation factor Ts [Clostridium botulinum]KON12571.1 elongation factor Ts [Clostridium botulinum]MBN1038182.1 elongation factor Ts [Clostridium botulinum]